MSGQFEELLHATLVLVAHPDDESLGCGVLLQRIARASILVCTDGAPDRWPLDLVRKVYAARRRAELRAAVSIARVEGVEVISGIQDQGLHKSLNRAAAAIAVHVRKRRPRALLTHAFEAGHPDHDACAFLAQWAGRTFSLPVWEIPLYHRLTPLSPLTYQEFLIPGEKPVAISPSATELNRKRLMLSMYRSQQSVISGFDPARELYRPQPDYDFARSPNVAVSTYAVCNDVPINAVLGSLQAFRG